MLKNIPKIIHLYWGKNNPLTFLQYLTVVSFNEYNPDWKIKIYYPTKISNNISWNSFEQKTKIISKDYFEELSKISQLVEKIEVDFNKIGFSNDYSEVIKSDFFRYYILYEQGGIWSDFDVVYIKSLNNINYNNFKHYGDSKDINFAISYISNGNNPYYSIGFIVSSPKNTIFKVLMEKAKNNINTKDYQSIGCVLVKEVLGNSPEKIKLQYKDVNTLIFTDNFYVPYNPNDIKSIYDTKQIKITANTVGVHWYNGSPISRKFENKLERNENCTNSILWKYIKKYKHLKTL
jgi:mannosyltransferase OCH1-like enzyme